MVPSEHYVLVPSVPTTREAPALALALRKANLTDAYESSAEAKRSHASSLSVAASSQESVSRSWAMTMTRSRPTDGISASYALRLWRREMRAEQRAAAEHNQGVTTFGEPGERL